MTEDHLNEVKAGKSCPALVRFQGPVRERVGSQWVMGKVRVMSQGQGLQLSPVVLVLTQTSTC